MNRRHARRIRQTQTPDERAEDLELWKTEADMLIAQLEQWGVQGIELTPVVEHLGIYRLTLPEPWNQFSEEQIDIKLASERLIGIGLTIKRLQKKEQSHDV